MYPKLWLGKRQSMIPKIQACKTAGVCIRNYGWENGYILCRFTSPMNNKNPMKSRQKKKTVKH